MKKLYLSILAVIAGITIGYTQNAKTFGPAKRACYFDRQLSTLNDNPEALRKFEEQQDAIQQYIKTKGLQKSGNEIIIPVFVKILYEDVNGPENISDDQVLSQLNALNTYFEPYNIRFCLSRMYYSNTLYPGPNPGIVRQQNAALSNLDLDTELDQLFFTGYPPMPSNQLNIYVVKSLTDSSQNGTVVGIGSPPGFNTGFDGVVMRADAFGNINDPLCTSCVLDPTSNQGKILVHEVGHYLALFHTFMGGCEELYEGNCETKGDRVCDTPPVAQENNGCPTGINTCNESPDLPDDINNYMDYTDENCLNGFTEGQVDRMIATLQLYRAQLISTENLAERGIDCINPILLTSFTAPNYSPCVGTGIDFTATAISGASYLWDFGDPDSGPNNTSTLSVPSHVYTAAGIFTVTLTITLGSESVSVTKQVYPVNCSPITGPDTTWLFGTSNALNFQSGVPEQAPVVDNYTQAYFFYEACAVQSEPMGGVLFYTNGVYVFNGAQAPINHTNQLYGGYSSHDGSIILPDPVGGDRYYIFNKSSEATTWGFTYTKVQMVGGGTPVLSAVNTPVTFPSGYSTGFNGAVIGSEGITAIQNCNGYWLITGLLKPGNQHFVVVYSLDSTGLHYVSELQTPAQYSMGLYQNTFRASPDGNHIAAGGYSSYYLMDFNKNTGILSNIRDMGIHAYSNLCFSPNSKYIYVTAGAQGKVYQYDITVADLIAGREETNMPTSNTGQMQIGPDKKLYFTVPNSNRLGVIHFPDVKATIDEPNAYHFSLNGPLTANPLTLALPNVVVAKAETVYNNTISYAPVTCFKYNFVANACGSSFSWNFGDSLSGPANTSTLANPTHTFTAPGTYTVTLNTGSGQISKTITVGGIAPLINGSTSACTETVGQNKTSHSAPLELGTTVQWSITSGSGSFNGPASYPYVSVTWTSLPGTIKLSITDSNGCVSIVTQTITSNCETSECPGDLVLATPYPAYAATYNVSNSITCQNHHIIESGSDVDLFAGKVIVLKPKTWMKSGAEVLGAIVSCPAGRPMDTEDIEAPQLIVYPNPTTGLLHLTGKPIKEVMIFDVLGKEVYHSAFENVYEATLNISTLQKGMYLAKVTDSEGMIETVKIIKE